MKAMGCGFCRLPPHCQSEEGGRGSEQKTCQIEEVVGGKGLEEGLASGSACAEDPAGFDTSLRGGVIISVRVS